MTGMQASGRMAGISARLNLVMRTTAFQLSVLYLTVFVVFAVFVLGYLSWNTRRLLDAQITETIETEINGLAEQYRLGDLRRLITIIERRGRQSGSFLYLLIDRYGDAVTGNALLRVPVLAQDAGWHEFRFNWPHESDEPSRIAKLRVYVLESGHRLFVGRDLEERARLQEVVRRARGWSLLMVVALGGFGAWFVTKRVLARIDAIARSSSAILAGNLEERLPVMNSQDEFDRLAGHINHLLDRINALMAGLSEVSDNVAHDLRTPLTRLRNGAEEALRKASTLEEAKAALERAIAESDGLIRGFDGLLMIARAQSGHLAPKMTPLRLDEIAGGMAELYAPAAEEAGLHLVTRLTPDISIRGNRELLAQAIANLIDNAIKYGKGEAVCEITLALTREGADVVLVVADRGPGIGEADRERVRKRFVRLDPSRGQVGFGLGLSLVQAVAQLHGARFTLEDNAPGLRAKLVFPAELVL
jgi:signal transduction histidine kinase